MDPMKYEDAIRYVFDRCERFEQNGDANTDIFRGAQVSGDWNRVAAALGRALERIEADAAGISWSTNERDNGGVEPNFRHPLQAAAAALRGGSDPTAAYVAISSLVHAMKALVLKAGGDVPTRYQGQTPSRTT